LQKPPKHFSFAGIHAIQRVPRASGTFVFHYHDSRAIWRKHDKVCLITGISETSPVAREGLIAQCPQKAFGGSLARISRTKVRKQAIRPWMHAMQRQPNEIEHRDPRSISREMRGKRAQVGLPLLMRN